MKRPDDLSYTGIEAIFRAQRELTEERFVQIDEAGLMKWARASTVTYWQAVALHSFLDPDALGITRAGQWEYLEEVEAELRARERSDPSSLTALDRSKIQLFDNLSLLGAAMRDRQLGPVHDGGPYESVELLRFHAWSVKVGLKVVTGWPRRSGGDKWPWGRHSTPRLEALAAAAAAHWRHVDEGGGYVSGDKTTASTNPQVAEWIQERFPGVGYETALVMARILRDPALDTGRPLGS